MKPKMMRLPSGDQTGDEADADPNVNRVLVPLEKSTSQRPATCSSPLMRDTAACVPSGERLIVGKTVASSPTVPKALPWRSYQVSCLEFTIPVRYANTPLVE